MTNKQPFIFELQLTPISICKTDKKITRLIEILRLIEYNILTRLVDQLFNILVLI